MSTIAAKQLVAKSWELITGDEPPEPGDPDTPLRDAVIWSIASVVLLIAGVGFLAGIGFTMSLFIGLLAFAGRPDLEAETKVGVLIGSLACMAAGALVLRFAPAHPSRR